MNINIPDNHSKMKNPTATLKVLEYLLLVFINILLWLLINSYLG